MLRKAPRPETMPAGWWTMRWLAIGCVLLSLVPLLLPSMPPLIDLPGHIGRYRVQLDLGSSELLRRYYDFHWALMGNLGVDLLVEALAPLFGLEPAVKLIILSIPATTVAGLLLVAREVHGRVPPTAMFALPLAYCFPFQFGFVNFALSMGWALLAFALWLRLARLGRLRLRALLFVPLGAVIWLAHGFGWGVLGLLAFAAEIMRARVAGRAFVPALFHAAIQCVPLAPPMLLMIAWRSGDVAGQTTDWFNFGIKLWWLGTILREHWADYDLACAILLYGIILAGLTRFGIDCDPMLRLAGLFLAIAFLLLPRILLGSNYADMRLMPYAVAILLVALGPGRLTARQASLLGAVALGFLVMRTATTTYVFAQHERAWRRQLAAIDHIPRGARIFSLVQLPCQGSWDASRMDHINSYAIARRDAFVNAQWQMTGAQLVRVDYPPARGFDADPTQIVRPLRCRPPGTLGYRDAIARFPHNAFDYLWLIDVPPRDWPRDPSLMPMWQRGSGVLYRIAAPLPRAGSPE